MGKKLLIAVAAGLLLMSASGAWADVTVPDEQVAVPEEQQVAGGPGAWTATHNHRILKAIPRGKERPEYITGWGYVPSQIRDYYGFSGLSADGTGQTIAIVDAYGSPTIAHDLNKFCQTYGLPLPAKGQLTVRYMGGVAPPLNRGWAMETSLDVEWTHALAPGAKILLVVAQSNSFNALFAAVRYAAQRADVVSMSWGGSEFPSEASYDNYFQHTGTVFLAASGDSGSGAQYPAASPNVVAVGGTALYLQNGTGTPKFSIPEVAWEGAGGGVSNIIVNGVSVGYEPMPPYQELFGLTGQIPQGQPQGRCIPDVAFLADLYTGVVVYNSNYNPSAGNLWVVGGTSVAAQCWGAIIALADQVRGTPLTDGHSALYSAAGTNTSYTAGNYNDITIGYNGDFAAITGYDFITGIGSPMVSGLVPALAAQ